ncbi:disintegrin and metalloproteinase domain-containing protein 33 [Danio rerio]|uniref:Disintegrin and metalloproteinase domain-containing protein 33 n=1 Tax=Danio rerio TaxID=7955 RepID=A0A8M2BJN9_DANRE|nr:disintegrin and metalloproteinase domain-containing protein 19 isoform X1 [Danio rerio]|eukprot:XP_005172418.1 disintegrin and metalloproteinase domain-containing protein 19 isoform X1 [Danio rerio]
MYTKHRQKSGHISSTRYVLVMLSVFLFNGLLEYVGGNPREEDRGQRVTVHWISHSTAQQEPETTFKDKFPESGEILVSAQDLELVLQVERNQELLGHDFTETHYENGLPITQSSHHTDHCFYHGRVRGHADSWVALSTCLGMRGLIVLNSNDTFYLEPIRGQEVVHHAFYRTEDLPIKSGTCGHSHHTGQMSLFSGDFKPLHQRVRRNAWGTTKYMELYIVADNTLYRKQNKDLDKTKLRIMEIANYVDKFYRELNIRVPLIGLEVWTEHDQCIINEEPNSTLWSFLQWRQKLKSRKKHDNAQLLTGVIFKGTTIGMAPLEGMCSHENSGGINVDHSELPIGAAATMAHEIGHNFGMSHDHEGCCVEATAEQGGCVMAAATGHPFPKVFSRCSKKDLDNYFQKGGGMCLFNMPNMKDLVGGKRCGNGFVEEGEECDCGEPEECTNDCCHPSNCTLKVDAQCAHGVCCEGCKLKQAGTMCRGPAGACDLPEYCTGGSPYCPSNVYLLDGSSCQYGRAYCYNGMCLTHEQQCLQLWGYGAQPAHDACFQDVNAAGNAFGNCGKDSKGNYMKCEKSDAKCGKIQCHSAAKKPKGTNAVSIDTTIQTDGIEVKCRGTFVYSTQDGQGDLPDPGLVMTGTKCGEGKVCKDRRCQNTSFTELESCIVRCHGHGVCNSNGNCHCSRGWAPPFCEKPGLGGSVDSGPVQYDSQVGLVVGLLFAFLVLLPAVLIAFYCVKIKSSYYHKWRKQREKSKASRHDTSTEKGKNGHLNPAFHLKVVGPNNRNANIKLPHTSKEVLPLRPNPATNGPQPVNIVRPLRPAPSPSLSNMKGPRPPPPISKPPNSPKTPKTVASPQKLSPPKKPLPLNPSRTPLMVSQQQPRPPSTPPQRPLPLSPARGAQPRSSSGGLMVMMPPAVGPKPVGKVTAVPPLKAFQPASGPKPLIVPAVFRK